MSAKLACGAALWYNQGSKIVVAGGTCDTPARIHLTGDVPMDTLSPYAPENNPAFEQLQLAYFAGIVDGEGCISIACKKPRLREKRPSFQPRLHITNTDRRLIDWLQAHYGGTLVYTPSTPLRQELLTLRWCGKTARVLMQRVLPYLVIKAEKATLVLEAWSRTPEYIGNQSPLPDEIWEEYERAYIQLRALNAWGSRKVGTLAPLFQTRKEV